MHGVGGVQLHPVSLFSHADANGPSLYVSGSFFNPESGDAYITRWGGRVDSFDEYCFGDGGLSPGCTSCPCSNDASSGTGGGCVNSYGRSAILMASGSPEVGADSLRFEVSGAASNSFGLLISAHNKLPALGACPVGSGIVSFDGLRCTGGALLRHGSRATDGMGDSGATTPGWGPPNGPSGGLIASGSFTAGQTRHFQVFYRDAVMGGCGTGQNSTNAVSVLFQ